MKKIFLISALITSFTVSKNSFSQVSIRSGTYVAQTIPVTSADRLRVENGNFSQRVSGTIGQFGSSDQWIRIGKPSSDLYGTRVQWNQQALTNYLTQRPGTAIKDAVIGWGDQGGEMQFRYLQDSKSYLKVLSLTSAGNAYVGWRDTVTFTNPKFMINAGNQLAFAIKDSANTAVSIVNVQNNPDVYAIVPSVSINASANGTGRTDGLLSIGSGGDDNHGLIGQAIGGGNYNAGVQGFAVNAGVSSMGVLGNSDHAGSTGFGVYAQAVNSVNNIGLYATAYGGESNLAGYFAGDVYSSGTYTGSDKKLKRDIKPEESIMDKIKNLKPVLYNYKSAEFKTLNLPKSLQHGFIAQDVKEIFPEMVTTLKDPAVNNGKLVNNEQFLAINYTMFIPVLTKGLQEQQAYIEKLERRITDLENALQKTSDVKVKEDFESVKSVSIDQNVPNPFNQKTTISYSIPSQFSNASIVVFDLNGKLLLQYDNLKGKSQVAIEGNKLSAGMYIYSLLVNGKEITSKKMILTK